MRAIKILVAVLVLVAVSASAEVQPRKKNVASNLQFAIYDSATGDAKTGLSDIACCYMGGTDATAPSACTAIADTSETEIASKGVYTVDLAAGELNFDRVLVKCESATSGAMDAVVTIDTTLSGLISPRGLAQSATGTTIVLASTEPATDDIFTGNTSVTIASGTGVGQTRCITDYVGSSKTATVDTWTTNPNGTSYYDLIATPGCNASGAVTIASGGITAASFATGAITADSIAANAITSSEFGQSAADAVWSTTTRALTDKSNFNLASSQTFNVTGNISGTVGVCTALGTDALSAAAVSTAGANELADIILRRSSTNIEGSGFGDTLGHKSLYGVIAQQTHRTGIVGDTWSTYRSDGVTLLNTRTVTTSSSAAPMTGVGN